VAAFLSPAWLAALREAAERAPVPAGVGADGPRVVVQQVVTGGPRGIVEYHVVVDRGVTSVRAGRAPDPTITFTQDRDTAAAVSRGELSAQGAFMTGRIRVRGNLTDLIERQAVLAGLDDMFASVRDTTEY
jgi:hypothetical protein